MTAALARFPGQAPIEAYGNGGFRFAGMSHRGSIVCLPSAIVAWPVTSLETITPENLVPILAERAAFSVLLFGIGRQIVPIPGSIVSALKEAGVAFDVMDTGAAARTYNVLLAERRAVAAALIAVD